MVRLRVLSPGIITELLVNRKTLWSWGGKLQSDIGDVIGLVCKYFREKTKKMLSN